MKRTHFCLLLFLSTFFSFLEAVENTTIQPNPPMTIVVTEFQNRHPLLDQDWISSALADLVTTSLSSAASNPENNLTVLDRTSIASLENEAKLTGNGSPAQGNVAMRALGGSFQSSEDGSLTVEVVLSSNGNQLWAQKISGTVLQLSALARKIANGAMAALSTKSMAIFSQNTNDIDLPIAALVTFQRGRTAAARGDHATAIADFLRTCKLAPNNGEAWLALGTSFSELGRRGAALAAWEQAILVDPDHPGMAVALFRLALAEEERNPQQAYQLYQQIIKNYPFFMAPSNLLEKKNIEKGMKIAEVAMQRLSNLRIEAIPLNKVAGINNKANIEQGKPSKNNNANVQVVDAYRRRIQAISQRRSNNYYASTENEEMLRLGLLSAAGGWPEDWPVTRLIDGQPVTIQFGSTGGVISPPPGMVIESLTTHIVPKPGFKKESIRYALHIKDIQSLETYGKPFIGSSQGEDKTVEIPAKWASGFYATGGVIMDSRAGQTRTLPAELQLSAKLRPEHPGMLWITTQPAGVLIKIDNVERGVTPCLIRDITPGRHMINADSFVVKNRSGPNYIFKNYLRFRSEASVNIPEKGETRIEWTLQHAAEPDGAIAGWSPLQLAVESPVTADVLGITVSNNLHSGSLSKNIKFTQSKKFGEMMFWLENGDICIAVHKEGSTWKRMEGNVVKTATSVEELVGVAQSPSGELTITFVRDREFSSSKTTDLKMWSRPQKVSTVGVGRRTNSRELALATNIEWTSLGQWMVVYYSDGPQHLYTSISKDGNSWNSIPTPITHSAGWFTGGQFALGKFEDGQPALIFCATARINKENKFKFMRYKFQDPNWIAVDESPEFTDVDYKMNYNTFNFDPVDNVMILSSYKGDIWSYKAGDKEIRTVGKGIQDYDYCYYNDAKNKYLFVPWAGAWWVTSTDEKQQITLEAPKVTYEYPINNAQNEITPQNANEQKVNVSSEDTLVSSQQPQTNTVNEHESQIANVSEEAVPSAKKGMSFLTFILIIIGSIAAVILSIWMGYEILNRRRGDKA